SRTGAGSENVRDEVFLNHGTGWRTGYDHAKHTIIKRTRGRCYIGRPHVQDRIASNGLDSSPLQEHSEYPGIEAGSGLRTVGQISDRIIDDRMAGCSRSEQDAEVVLTGDGHCVGAHVVNDIVAEINTSRAGNGDAG